MCTQTLLTRLLLAALLLAGGAMPVLAARPVGREALMAALQKGGLSTAELAAVIRTTGVDFALTPADEQGLKGLGAEAALIDVVKSSRVSGNVRSDGRPLAPVELVTKLFHSSPAVAAAALRTRGAGFDLTPQLEAQILETGGDRALVALAVLRRLEPEFRPSSPSAAAEAEEESARPTAVRNGAPNSPAAATATVTGPRPVRVDAAAQARKLLRKVEVEYPQVAFRARMSGRVVVDMLIGRDGRVRRARAARGDEIFFEAAVTAVSQYVYRPTLLDEEPIEVISEVILEFDLDRASLGMKN